MRYSVPDGILCENLPDEAVVLNLSTAEYFHLNCLAAAAWKLIRLGVPRREIEAALNREYDAPLERIRSDLDAFLNRMVELKLVTVNPE